ncbi:hypothetical protein [Prescottella agglutinans]|uniref:DUF3828 domain-containing protein n=1 Tax=Prescottella agglutinans TaxID=1644129 RepID=A0ABT6MJX0_9NOCA|nr:hypothetical protein [Prescottella agglutinans]MDH6284580.1 hypothetical protein [Prescottella agglutinans]
MSARRPALQVIAATLTAVALLVAGCSSDEPAAPRTETTDAPPAKVIPYSLPTLDITDVDTTSPDAVALAFARTAYTLLPSVDPNQNEGMVRAAPLLDGKLAASVQSFNPPTGPGYEWNQWAKARALVTATAELGTQEVPPETPTEAFRMVQVTQTVESSSRFIARKSFILLVSMVRTPDGWRVDRITQL